ncbi:hypothetical protein [Psychrobacter pygoscelis]|uniref:hypothetical protein n=1 Tax=Psychrobacter pygoscelis TaxID=2488563 RepID=UPI00104039AE|nr:hypothetical protein [Psychrobacter pygoscelis]
MDLSYFLGGLIFLILIPLIRLAVINFKKDQVKRTPTWQYLLVFIFMSLIMLIGNHEHKVLLVIAAMPFYLYALYHERQLDV